MLRRRESSKSAMAAGSSLTPTIHIAGVGDARLWLARLKAQIYGSARPIRLKIDSSLLAFLWSQNPFK